MAISTDVKDTSAIAGADVGMQTASDTDKCVTIYTEAKFRGESKDYYEGTHKTIPSPWADGNINSARVGSCCVAVLYNEIDCVGDPSESISGHCWQPTLHLHNCRSLEVKLVDFRPFVDDPGEIPGTAG